MKQHIVNKFTCMFLCMLTTLPAGAQVFVVPGGAGNEDGSSWANAYGDIQVALEDPRTADEDVWIAGGTYVLSEVIVWPAGVAGYGGFAGNESELAARDIATNETVLDAQGEGRVIRAQAGTNRRIDGFTITNGVNVADAGAPAPVWGAGMQLVGGDASNVIANCWIKDNVSGVHAGGILLHNNSNYTIENCVFENNTANIGGAVMVNTNSSPTFSNCIFIENQSSRSTVMSRDGSDVSFVNCVFINNTHDGNFGGTLKALLADATIDVQYSTFYGNSYPEDRPSVFMSRSAAGTITVSNSIVWGNSTNVLEGPVDIINSIVQDGEGGGLDVDPLFVDAENGDLRLQANSPAINMGTAWPATDVLGVSRPQGQAADLGAYEREVFSVTISGPSTAQPGQVVVYTAQHNGVGDIEIAWHKDGQPIDGADSEELNLGEVSEVDSGMYTVFVTADNGEANASIVLNVVSGLSVVSTMMLMLLITSLVLSGLFLLQIKRT